MSEIAKLIDDTIRGGLAPVLKQDGYRKSGRTFHAVRPESVLVVNVQASTGNVGSVGRFTINLGLYLPAVETVLNGTGAMAALPKEYECTVRTRLKHNGIGGTDQWWEISG